MAYQISKGTSKDAAFVEMQLIKNLGLVRKTLIFHPNPHSSQNIWMRFFFFNQALREREKDLMTNELRTFTEARKQLSEIINGIRGMETSKRLVFLFIVLFNSSIDKEQKRVTGHLHGSLKTALRDDE